MRTARLPLAAGGGAFFVRGRAGCPEDCPGSSRRVQDFDVSKSHFDVSNCDFDGSKWEFDGSKCGFAPACWELLRGEAGGLPGCCSRNSLCKQFRASREIVIFRGLGMKFRLLLAAFPCIFYFCLRRRQDAAWQSQIGNFVFICLCDRLSLPLLSGAFLKMQFYIHE